MLEAYNAEMKFLCRALVFSVEHGRIGFGPLDTLAGNAIDIFDIGYTPFGVRPSRADPSINVQSFIHRSIEELPNGIYAVEFEAHIIWRTIEPFYLNHESWSATAP